MLFKRLYDPAALDGPGPRPNALALGHTGTHAAQNFSADFVAEAVAGGYAALDGDTLRLTVQTGAGEDTLRYAIKRRPGYYSCHDGQPIPISDLAQREALSGIARLAAAEARAWLAAHGHAGKASPDPQQPAGYAVTHSYECELDAAQHARYRLPAGTPPALALSFDSIRAARAQEA